jgi:carboxyl-terminal processing protease
MRKLGIIVVGLLIVISSWGFSKYNSPNPDKDKLLLEIIAYVLERGHYDPTEVNDEFSEQVFHKYIQGLDGQHRFFLQVDVSNFKRYKTQIDDQLKAAELAFFDLTYQRLQERMEQVKGLLQ